MLKISFLLCLYVASTLACSGCTFNAENFEVKSCGENSEKYFNLKCEAPELTEDCQVKTNCTRDFPEKITKMMVQVSGTHNNVPFTKKMENICEEIHNLAEDRPCTQFMKMYGLDNCPDGPVNKGFVSTLFQLTDDQKSKVSQGEGISKAKIELMNINGEEGANACYEVTTQLDCPKMKRKG